MIIKIDKVSLQILLGNVVQSAKQAASSSWKSQASMHEKAAPAQTKLESIFNEYSFWDQSQCVVEVDK